MEKFLYVLLAAVLLWAVLIAFLGMEPVEEELNNSYNEEIGAIGVVPDEISRNIYFGDFAAKYGMGDFEAHSRDVLAVESGFLSDDAVYEDEFDIPEDKLLEAVNASVSLRVARSNPSSPLKVLMNGKEIFSERISRGMVSAYIPPESLNETNTITVRTEPGWMFWSSSVYEIEDLSVSVSYYGKVDKEFRFSPEKEEYDRWVAGKLEFDARGEGNLLVYINSINVFNDSCNSNGTVMFNRTPVYFDKNNTVRFETARNGHYEVWNAQLDIIFETDGFRSKEESFEIDSRLYADLKKGTVRGKAVFWLEKIVKPGILDVEIIDSKGRSSKILFQTIEEEKGYSFDIDPQKVYTGTNKIRFSSEDGSFIIPKLEIKFE